MNGSKPLRSLCPCSLPRPLTRTLCAVNTVEPLYTGPRSIPAEFCCAIGDRYREVLLYLVYILDSHNEGQEAKYDAEEEGCSTHQRAFTEHCSICPSPCCENTAPPMHALTSHDSLRECMVHPCHLQIANSTSQLPWQHNCHACHRYLSILPT